MPNICSKSQYAKNIRIPSNPRQPGYPIRKNISKNNLTLATEFAYPTFYPRV